MKNNYNPVKRLLLLSLPIFVAIAIGACSNWFSTENNIPVTSGKFGVQLSGIAANTSFSFQLSATGNFTVDWGDGTIEPIVRTSTNSSTYIHTYKTSGNYTVSLDGLATGYNTSTIAAISFSNSYNKTKMTGIFGSLGKIFPIVDTTSSGTPRFYHTFNGCTGLRGSIPENLFAGISGPPVDFMFSFTFYECSGLTGTIPGKLFRGISGAPASGMFSYTFYKCSGLNSIEEGLFDGITAGREQKYMFAYTFSGCTSLTGPSATSNNKTPLYKKWASMDSIYSGGCYNGASGLDDYSSIPDAWK